MAGFELHNSLIEHGDIENRPSRFLRGEDGRILRLVFDVKRLGVVLTYVRSKASGEMELEAIEGSTGFGFEESREGHHFLGIARRIATEDDARLGSIASRQQREPREQLDLF